MLIAFMSCKQNGKELTSCLPKQIEYFHYSDINRMNNQNSIRNFFIEKNIEINQPIIWALTHKKEDLVILPSNPAWKKIIQDSKEREYQFKNWKVYQCNFKNHKLNFSFSNDLMIVSTAGYILEESLLCQKQKSLRLNDIYPQINEIKEDEAFLPLQQLLPQKMEHLLFQEKVISKGKFNLHEGKILNYKLPYSQGKPLWKKMFSALPKSLLECDFHNYKLQGNQITKLEKIVNTENGITRANFKMKNPLGENYSYVLLEVEKDGLSALEKIEKIYGISEEIEDEFFPIKKIVFSNLCNELSNVSFLNCIQQPFAIAIDNYILFANKKEAIDFYLDEILTSNTLASNNEAVLLLNDKICSDTLNGSIYYLNTENSNDVLSIFNSNGISEFKHKNTFKNNDEESKLLKSIWRKKMNATIILQPSILPSKDGEIIAIQDQFNFLRFYNLEGKELWKKRLNDVIQSEIQYCPDFETQKDGYVFSTKNEIHFMDVSGNEKENFPILLNSPALNGIQLIPFNNREMIYGLIACQNGNYYGFDMTKKGQPLRNWNPLVDVISFPHDMKFLKGKDESHILFIHKNNALVSLDRNAEKRFSSVLVENEYLGEIFIDSSPSSERIILSNGKGKIKVINTKGEMFHLSVSKKSLEGEFIFSDIIGDERKDYIFHHESLIKVNYYKGNEFEQFKTLSFPFIIESVFEVEFENTKNRLGLSANNKIYLLDENLEVEEGFPIQGSSAFKIIELKQNEYLIITYLDDELIAYFWKNKSIQ